MLSREMARPLFEQMPSNVHFFAADLKDVLNTYEKRLGNISVIMTYIREERMIYVTIKGTILETQEPYSYMTTINVWK